MKVPAVSCRDGWVPNFGDCVAWLEREDASSNPLERLNKEIKCRADVVGIFPNEGSIIRLIGAVLLEANDEWALQHRYMQTEAMAELTPPMIDTAPTSMSTVAA